MRSFCFGQIGAAVLKEELLQGCVELWLVCEDRAGHALAMRSVLTQYNWGDGEGSWSCGCPSMSGIRWCFESAQGNASSETIWLPASSTALVGLSCLGRTHGLWGGNNLEALESCGPSCKNNPGFSKTLCFFSSLPPRKSCLLMRFHP